MVTQVKQVKNKVVNTVQASRTVEVLQLAKKKRSQE